MVRPVARRGHTPIVPVTSNVVTALDRGIHMVDPALAPICYMG